MIDRLRTSLRKRVLKVYFDHTNNLLKGKDEFKIDKVINNIDLFLDDPKGNLQKLT